MGLLNYYWDVRGKLSHTFALVIKLKSSKLNYKLTKIKLEAFE